MSTNNNNDGDQTPFANLEFGINDISTPEPKSKKTSKKPSESTQWSRVSNVYFEKSTKENDFIKLIPYIGPSNTIHLNQVLYLPQIIPSNQQAQSSIILERFIEDYNRVIASYITLTLSIYIRFGIYYITRATDSMINEQIPFADYLYLRSRGKEVKTSFYTCKGVTSPKQLISAIVKQNYEPISSNEYTYEIQIYGSKNNQNSVLHFIYNGRFECQNILYRPDFPMNFDFIRDKTTSRFRSIDESYSDIFDFRIQLTQTKSFSKTDPQVLATLRGVPVDEVLFIDPSTKILHVSEKLQKYVKYLKCIRSNSYQNFSEQILILIGSYEEFRLNSQGQCQPLMKASNTMTMEFHDLQTIPSAKKLFDMGMWFSSLCQTCVNLPTVAIRTNMTTFKWFSDILKKSSDHSLESINVNQLTTYKTQKSQHVYTDDELKFVKNILREENLREIFFKSTDIEQNHTTIELNRKYEELKKRLNNSEVPSAKLALKKLERAYRFVMTDFL